jgi:serine/threonine-protein kinase RsbW
MASLKIEAKMVNLDRMIDFIMKAAADIDFSKKQIYNINLASEEILVNIINYAYPEKNGDVEIKLNIMDNRDGLEISFIDWGIPFNPLLKESPDINVPAADRKIGGLGIHLVSQTMDLVKYKREEY